MFQQMMLFYSQITKIIFSIAGSDLFLFASILRLLTIQSAFNVWQDTTSKMGFACLADRPKEIKASKIVDHVVLIMSLLLESTVMSV